MTIRILFSTSSNIFQLIFIFSSLLFKFSHGFSEETIKFSVSEDAPINTIIGRLEAIDGFTYRLSRGNSKIKFDDQSLEFSTSSLLDRESENAIDMLIITSPPSIIHVLIDILDVNDNAPKFPLDIQKIEIPETAPIGWRVQISGATDPDEGRNGTIGKYELVETLITVDTSTPFAIVQSDDGFVFLEVTGKLDREQRDLYSMRLTATDKGTPELSSSCLLNIIILDTNDNPPDFGIRSITVHWNGLPNAQLFHLNATDADSGDNGRLTYRIQGPANDYFSIVRNERNEHILVTQNNTECLPRCELIIEARDSGVPPLSTTLNVVVEVEYGNEHEPNINIRFYPSDYPFIIVQPEDVNGKTLAILSITDPDGPLGENATIWIKNGNENSIFSLISRQSINILTLKNVENAEKEHYILEFGANDGQRPIEKTARKTLKIFFKKHVKSTYVHVEREFHVNVEKDTVPGSFVAHVVTNCSEMCTFELRNSDVFRIDESNGIIVTSSRLPDDVTSYHLPIRIHPPPPSTQILETDVFVKVIQESVPKNLIRSSEEIVHLKRSYTFSTWQNVSVGTVVGKLPRAQVYSTIDSQSELGVFPDGSIFVGKSISSDFVTLPVILENKNTTQTSLVTLLIKPLNQHAPNCHVTKIHVMENEPIGSIIGRLHATDLDSGVNGIVSYRILRNSEEEDVVFHVDSATGNLRNLKKLDAEKTRNYTIFYGVQDFGTPPKSTNCTGTIYIEDVNDHAPEFSSKYYSAKISGKSNETVAIVHANDEDVEERNRRIQYRLLNLNDFFHVDKDSGKVSTIQNLPKTFGRINISIETVNVDSEDILTTTTFILVTVVNSTQIDIHLNSKEDVNVIRIYKNDDVGTKIGKIDVTSSESIIWKTEDSRFHVDSSGNIILKKRIKGISSESLDVFLLSEENGEEVKKLNFHVEFLNSDRNDDSEKIIELVLEKNSTKVMDLSENWKNWKLSRIISENSENSENISSFFIKNKFLYKSDDNSTSDSFVILESSEDNTFKILHVIMDPHLNPNTKKSETTCTSSVHLITPPSTVSLPRNCTDVSLQNQKQLQIHEDNLLIPTQTELISHVDLISNSIQKPFMMTLIKDENSEDVRFATNSVLMLLSSVHPTGASFGRVTAESGYRIRYYLVGTDKISIDADTGELFLKERFFKNLNDILIVAVIPKGIAKAKVTIEVIEDRLVLSKSNFFIISPLSLKLESPIGRILIDRDDVIIDVIDEHFYVRKSEVFAKRHFIPSAKFYDLSGTVKKGKLSAPINVTLFFGSSMDKRDRKENELMMEVEENSPIGTVVGTVPNYPTSKYRLIDPSCGFLIDQEGIIRTSTIFDREKTSLVKTKMIEPSENRIWDLLIFIGDVNDNKPKILNAPGRIIVSEDLKYKLLWEDSDDVASDVNFSIVDGDPFGHLEVSDSGDIHLTSTPSESFNATIRINDNRPPFKVNSDDVTIEFHVDSRPNNLNCEDSEFWILQNGHVGTMNSDSEEEKVTWRIVPRGSGNGSSEFYIDPMTGKIQKIQKTSSKNILRRGDVFNLKIQVISYDAERTGFCTAKIHVAEDSESEFKNLKFSNETFEFSVLETTDRFTEIGRIHVITDSEDVVFRIQDNDFNFTISPFDGTIFTNSPLDYEDVKMYEFNVTASTPTSTSTCHVIIRVIDENDETPRFITGDVVNLRVREEETTVQYPLIIGSSIAEDLDDGQNGVVTYSILSGNTSLFAVNSTTGDILSLGPLNREESALYELQLEAKDAGIPSLSATSRILIHVDDVNDNSPEFELPSYFVKTQENLPIGTKILRIQATDKDLGTRLQYSLDDVEDSGAPFRIDVATGWITVAGKVDREEHSEFRIHVVVTDGERSSRTLVEILVEDVNDNSPIIENQNLDVFIPDDVEGRILHVIDVNDVDRKDHLKFHLNSSTFKISENGEILMAASTSGAKFPSSILVTVTDDVGHVASSEYRFYQHPRKDFPVFTEKMDTVSVKEHDEQELAVFKANGKGHGEEVRYSIVSRCKEHLEMESISGILKTKSSLDREEFSECPVFIIATSYVDNKPLSTITKILIKIVDINDNSPRFDQQLYRFNVTENSGPTLIGHVIARDVDLDSRIFYEIVSGDPNHEFMITENGQIESIRDLDRESQSEYRLILEAFDDGKPRRRGNTTVIVKVLDEDDNAPRFSRIFHVEVPEDVKVGESIIQLSASDSDEQSNHRFELDSVEEIPFRIEEHTGMVYVNDTLDFEKKSSYRIKVRLTDGAWLIETSLFVNVKDVNDNFPIFEQNEYFFISNENFTIGQIHASDVDSENNGKIRYSVTSPFFRIHPDSGILTKLRPLPDALTTLEVIASDHGIPRLQKSVNVYVAEMKAFRMQKEERIRKSANEEDVIGKGFSSGALIFPRGIATVTRDGNLILKEKPKEFWILENSTMTSYVVVNNTKSDEQKNHVIILNATSSASDFQIHVPGCSEFLFFGTSDNKNSDDVRISKNGFLKLTGLLKTTHLKVECHDGIWPIQNPKHVDVTVNLLKSNDPLIPTLKTSGSRIPKKTLPKTLELKMSSESPSGTILWQYDAPISMENNGILNLTRGKLILNSKLENPSQIEIFSSTDFRRSIIKIISETGSPACPIFPQNFYFFEKSAEDVENSEIHNFGWNSENIKDCRIEVENQNLFYVNDSRLISLKPLLSGTYQFTLNMKSISDQSIRSICHVTVTVPLPTPTRGNQNLPTVIFASNNIYSNPIFQLPTEFTLLENSEKSTFTVTDSGAVRSRSTLNNGQVYQFGVVEKGKKNRNSSEVIRILFDDVASESSGSEDVNYHVISNPSSLLNLDVGTSKCAPKILENYEVTEDCHVITPSDVINKTIPVSTSLNSTWNLHVIRESTSSESESENLQKNAVTLEILAQKSAISHLITDLRTIYNDMKIHCLATWQISEDVKYHVTFSIVDRNGVIVEASEARRTLTSFLKKHRPLYLEFLGFQRDACDGVTCIQKNSTCQKILEPEKRGEASRIVSRSSATIFDLPMKKLIGKCICENGKLCEEDTKIENLQKDDVISIQKTCDDVDCGPNGKCVMFSENLPICHCTDGKSAFESMYSCEKALDVFSMPSGGHLEISLKKNTSETLLKCNDDCKEDVQKLEFDFRTIQMKSEILRVNFGKQIAIIELISGSITFSISDEFTRPIETRIEKRVNDGHWHRFQLQMTDDGRRISIQVDGRGKEVKSRLPLPMLFTSKRIQLMTSSEFCFRRLLAQNQFIHPILSNNKLFDVHVIGSTSSVSSTCQFDPIPSHSIGFFSNFSDTTTVILLLILAIISLIALSLCLLAIRRRWIQKSSGDRETGWKKATEINSAFAVPRRIGHGGHVNRSMVKSPDDDTYDVATSYGTQMKSTSTDDMTHIYTSSSSRRYQPPVPSYRRDGHINMAYL